MTIPSLIWMPSGSFTPAWLHGRMSAIYGSSLVGLWIGEDLIANGLGDVTSWPGRVGGTMSAGALPFKCTTSSGRTLLSNTLTTAMSYMQVSVGTVQDLFAVAAPGVLPFADYRTLIGSHSTYNNSLCGDAGTSNLVDRAGTEYVNGLQGRSVTTNLSVLEMSGAITSPIDVGGWTAGVYNWIGTIGCVCVLSAAQTPAQRILSTCALKRYYGLAITPQEALAEALAEIYGTDLLGLWLIDDATVNGSTQVTSIPGRAGATMLPSNASNLHTRTALNGLYGMYASAQDVQRTYAASFGTNKTYFTFAVTDTPALPLAGYRCLVDNQLLGNTGTSSWYPLANPHTRDGVSTEVLTSGIRVYGSSAITASTIIVGGQQAVTDRNWSSAVGCFLCVTASSAAQTAACVAAFRAYYGF